MQAPPGHLMGSMCQLGAAGYGGRIIAQPTMVCSRRLSCFLFMLRFAAQTPPPC
jgi:hypothetical protein